MSRRSLGLLDLPAEVRIEVYSHLFRGSTLSVEPAFPAVSHCGFTICPCQFHRAILDTCRQLRREAFSYLLASTTLQLATTSHKLDLFPPQFIPNIPRIVILNVGQFLKRPLNFDEFRGLRVLELHNIAIWCRYHEEADFSGDDGAMLMLNLAIFNVKRHGAALALLCADIQRSFKILLFCRFVISSACQQTLV
jgi:hypothetical protein